MLDGRIRVGIPLVGSIRRCLRCLGLGMGEMVCPWAWMCLEDRPRGVPCPGGPCPWPGHDSCWGRGKGGGVPLPQQESCLEAHIHRGLGVPARKGGRLFWGVGPRGAPLPSLFQGIPSGPPELDADPQGGQFRKPPRAGLLQEGGGGTPLASLVRPHPSPPARKTRKGNSPRFLLSGRSKGAVSGPS